MLARCWCHKMQYLFGIAVGADDHGHVYTDIERQRYLEPTELTRHAEDNRGQQALLARINQIRALFS